MAWYRYTGLKSTPVSIGGESVAIAPNSIVFIGSKDIGSDGVRWLMSNRLLSRTKDPNPKKVESKDNKSPAETKVDTDTPSAEKPILAKVAAEKPKRVRKKRTKSTEI